MKSSLALLATAGAVAAISTTTEWVIEVVTVTVTVDPTDFVQDAKPTPTPAPEPVTTSSVVTTSSTPAPPPNSAIVTEPESTTTTQAPPPTSTPEPEPEPTVVETQTPKPQPTTTAQPQPTASQAPPQQSLAPSGGYQDTVVKYHNAYRQDHSAPALEWDDTLASYAQNTAQKCVFEHDMKQGTGNYGQNLASYGATGNLGTTESAVGKAIAQQWYQQEVGYYNFYGQADPPPGADFSKFGHFSQLVWKGSQKAGCYTHKCPAGTVLQYDSLFTVCNYFPPGNYKGEYGTNVMPSLGLKINVSS
ncbi:Allergen V5/Tpx-1-related protein [Cordyceps fumosorosea ARSEF 2679]|uniref:Allergen V5/Tpx-1-related protein n=1 Tax=Cordyceps fumosorosea (strain ARSEF 2679) TaxID=1081104 RepID=A0A167TJE8_CORFA|nr:Allergen V5/Tpx-1-related protein [Cordyceps fumosorosea ARSEF 2679]OAA60658.1 Allergen V5/Tpx-1-related protein [Cordyceps fumosorosea ARSEF 2679]